MNLKLPHLKVWWKLLTKLLMSNVIVLFASGNAQKFVMTKQMALRTNPYLVNNYFHPSSCEGNTWRKEREILRNNAIVEQVPMKNQYE